MRKIKKIKTKPTIYSVTQMNKQKLQELTPKFWRTLNAFMESDKADEKKFAVQEFNKIVIKLIPTQITSLDGDSLVKLSIVNYGDEDSIQLQAKTLSTPPPQGDGLGVSESSGDMAQEVSSERDKDCNG